MMSPKMVTRPCASRAHAHELVDEQNEGKWRLKTEPATCIRGLMAVFLVTACFVQEPTPRVSIPKRLSRNQGVICFVRSVDLSLVSCHGPTLALLEGSIVCETWGQTKANKQHWHWYRRSTRQRWGRLLVPINAIFHLGESRAHVANYIRKPRDIRTKRLKPIECALVSSTHLSEESVELTNHVGICFIPSHQRASSI